MFLKVFGPDIAIDLGTSNTVIAMPDRGILFHEPSVVALDINTYEVLAVGAEARNMVGKTPEHIVSISPLEEGIIADFETTQAMLTYFIRKASRGFTLFQPRVLIAIPSGLTDVERRAVEDCALHAGARDAFLIDEVLATGMGMGLPVEEPTGYMIVNIGGGTTEAGVISLGGVVNAVSKKLGGEHIDLSITEIIKREYNLYVGINSAEEIKKSIGTLNHHHVKTMEISGRDMITGMPKTVSIDSQLVVEAIYPVVHAAVDAIRGSLEKTPPEIAADIVKNGIYLSGGLSQLDGLAEYLTQEIKIDILRSEHPMEDVGRGTMASLGKMNRRRGKTRA